MKTFNPATLALIAAALTWSGFAAAAVHAPAISGDFQDRMHFQDAFRRQLQ